MSSANTTTIAASDSNNIVTDTKTATSTNNPTATANASQQDGKAGDASTAAAPATSSYFPTQEVAIGTLVRSFIVDGVFRDHFPQLSASSSAMAAGKGDGAPATGAGAPKVNVNDDGSTSHPPPPDETAMQEDAQLATMAIARDLLMSLRQPADVPLYTRCSAYPNTKRRLLCHPDLAPEEIRNTVPQQFLALFAVDVPAISLTAFAIRLVQRMHCGIDAFIWAVALMYRVSSKIPVCSRSVHRMLLAATVISAKCRNDIYYSMSFYSGVGGVARGDLRAMEVAMLTALDFTAYITPRTYVDLLYSMRQHCAQLTHTYKKAWASEAWAAFIVAVPLAHQAAFEPQAVLGPPGTPPHLKRANITIPARTKPHKSRTGGTTSASAAPADGKNNTLLGPAIGGADETAAKKAKQDKEGGCVSLGGAPTSTTGTTETIIVVGAPAVPAASGGGAAALNAVTANRSGSNSQQDDNSINGRQRPAQGAAGTAFAPSGEGKKSFAYYAATGDDGEGSTASDAAGAGNKRQPIVVDMTHVNANTSGPATSSGIAHPQQRQVKSGAATNGGANYLSRQQLQPFDHSMGTVSSSNNDCADVRSIHSSLNSFSGLAGPLSNSGASANMRLVGVGPVVRAVVTNANGALNGAVGGFVDQNGMLVNSGAPNGPFGNTGVVHPQMQMGALGAGNPNINPNFFVATASNASTAAVNTVPGGGTINVSRRYVPSANTSMNSFSDYTSSCSGSSAGGGNTRGAPRPTVVVTAQEQPSAQQHYSGAAIAPQQHVGMHFGQAMQPQQPHMYGGQQMGGTIHFANVGPTGSNASSGHQQQAPQQVYYPPAGYPQGQPQQAMYPTNGPLPAVYPPPHHQQGAMGQQVPQQGQQQQQPAFGFASGQQQHRAFAGQGGAQGVHPAMQQLGSNGARRI